MKYEFSDVVNEKYINGLTILRIHSKADKGVSTIMLTINTIYYIYFIHYFFIIFSSIHILSLCSEFVPKYDSQKYLSVCFRFFTPYTLFEKLRLSNKNYLIILIIIFIICIIRITDFILLHKRITKCQIEDIYKIKAHAITIIINHIIYVGFSYIVQFLSFIYYIEIFPDKFFIKKDDKMNIFNKIFLVLNLLLIVTYNYQNYFYFIITNFPSIMHKSYLKFRFPKSKIVILIILQNFSIFLPIPILLNGYPLELWSLIFSVFIISIFICLYCLTRNIYHYNNFIINTLSFIGEFSFISIIIEILLYSTSLTPKNYFDLISFTIIKIIVALCAHYLLEKIYFKKMFQIVENKVFSISIQNLNFDKEIIEGILFLGEQTCYSKNKKNLSKINELFINHQKKCTHNFCACKYIKLFSDKKSQLKEFDSPESFKNKIFYFIESILTKFNISDNCDLAYLLSEHIFLYRKNAIMSYSIIQTLIHYNYKKMDKYQLAKLYETLNIFIDHNIRERIKFINLQKFEKNPTNLIRINLEAGLKKFLNLLIQVKTVTKLMKLYCEGFQEIIKNKQNFENSIHIKYYEFDNEIKSINSTLLTNKFIMKLIKYLYNEIKETNQIQACLYVLNDYNKILPIEFIFKAYLFSELFWHGKIPEKFLDLYYGFTNNKNLYSTEVKDEIYDILENKYNENYYGDNKCYFGLFKYTKGLRIIYLTETLTNKLKIPHQAVVGQSMDILFPKEMIIPHIYTVNQYFIQKKNIFKHSYIHIFNSESYMIDCKADATLQIGLNRNMLIIASIILEEKTVDKTFFTNENFKLISINQNFEDALSITLPLIQEFNLGICDLFNISEKDLEDKFIKEINIVKKMKKFQFYDGREHIIRNVFKERVQFLSYPNNFEEFNVEENINDFNTLEQTPLNPKIKESETNNKVVQKIINNYVLGELQMKSVSFYVHIDNFIVNIKKILDKLCICEQDKLEKNNFLSVMEKLDQKLIHLNSCKKFNFKVNIIIKLLYDTPFYLCKIEEFNENDNNLNIEYSISNSYFTGNIGNSNRVSSKKMINNLIVDSKQPLNSTTDNIMLNNKLQPVNNNKTKNNKNTKQIISEYQKLLDINKIEKKRYGTLLVAVILLLLVSIILVFISQYEILHLDHLIYRVFHYSYLERTQICYIKTLVLSIYTQLVDFSDITNYDQWVINRDLLLTVAKKGKSTYYLFYNSYLDYINEINENEDILNKKLLFKEIIANWEVQIIPQSFINGLQVLLYRSLEYGEQKNYTEEEIIDCNNYMFGKYLGENGKKIEVHSDFIKILFSLYSNSDDIWRSCLDELLKKSENSFHKISNTSIIKYMILEVIGIIIFFIFFIINYWFLYKSNKYIFQNILCLFLDFTQSQTYTFVNKIDNYIFNKKIALYIKLLDEFSLDVAKNIRKVNFENELRNINLNFDTPTTAISENKTEQKKESKSSKKNRKGSENKKENKSSRNYEESKSINNVSQLQNSKNYLLGLNNSLNVKEMDIINNDISKLNYENLNSTKANNIYNQLRNNLSFNLNTSENNSNTQDKLTKINNNSANSLNINNSNIIKDPNKTEKPNINDESKLTIEKIIYLTETHIISVIKIIIITFIIFCVIFVIYYIIKIYLGITMISKNRRILTDFEDIFAQYNELLLYWGKIRMLFILPNGNYESLSNIQIEKQIHSLNIIIENLDMSNYPETKKVYNKLKKGNTNSKILSDTFCNDNNFCIELMNSDKNILLDGLESTFNLVAQDIGNNLRDFLKLQPNIKNKTDLKNFYSSTNVENLEKVVNFLLYYIQLKIYDSFYKDEEDMDKSFNKQIIIFNAIAFCYCLLLNFYSIFYVFNYVNNVNTEIEISTARIKASILLMKLRSENILK